MTFSIEKTAIYVSFDFIFIIDRSYIKNEFTIG